MSRLTGYPINYIRDNKVDAAKEFANKYKVVVLLKGYETVITNGKYTYICLLYTSYPSFYLLAY